MTTEYKAFRLVAGGLNRTAAAERLGVERTTVTKALQRLCRRYPGLDHALAVCRSVHEIENQVAA